MDEKSSLKTGLEKKDKKLKSRTLSSKFHFFPYLELDIKDFNFINASVAPKLPAFGSLEPKKYAKYIEQIVFCSGILCDWDIYVYIQG